jgi:hypothetical protein
VVDIEAITNNGDVNLALPAAGPYLVNAQSGACIRDTTVTVPQTANPDAAASRVAARSETGDVTIEDLR